MTVMLLNRYLQIWRCGDDRIFYRVVVLWIYAECIYRNPDYHTIGTMIVNNKMAFFSDALGHSALTGIALGVVMGVADTTLSMIIFAVIFALLLNYISSKASASRDTIISVFSSACIAVGLAILSKGGNFSKYSSLLVGDVLSISKKEIIYLILIFAATLIFWGLAFNKLNAVSLHRALARKYFCNFYCINCNAFH